MERNVTRRDFLTAAGVAAATKKKPNVILILTDDQGWTDTSVPMMRSRRDSRSDFYQTPALERMAREGMVFSNAYAPAPTCTPSRASIQFGKTPARLRQTVVHDVLAQSRGIDCHDEVSIARMVKSADARYRTAHFGKWGFPPRTPQHAGYDVTDGHTNNADGDWASKKDGRPLPPDDPKRIFSLTKRAAAFMARCVAARRPFFMQVSHYALHVQHYALAETVAKYRALPRGGKCTAKDYADPPPARNAWTLLYAAMIEDLDRSVGMLLDKIDELGIAGDTYVFFTADNGGGFRGNAPLKSGKASLWEGGIRVPTFVRGPGVRPGSQCDVPVAGWDFLPTISDVIGSARPLPDGIDGGSLRGLFEKGNDGKITRPAEGLVFHFPWYGHVPMSAIRLGDFKLVKNLNTGETRLFDLAKDLGETADLSKSMPAKADELHGKLSAYLKAVGAEKIEDMRAARKAELLGYMKRARDQIGKLQKAMAGAATDRERKALRGKLASLQKQLKAHEDAMARLEKARRITSW